MVKALESMANSYFFSWVTRPCTYFPGEKWWHRDWEAVEERPEKNQSSAGWRPDHVGPHKEQCTQQEGDCPAQEPGTAMITLLYAHCTYSKNKVQFKAWDGYSRTDLELWIAMLKAFHLQQNYSNFNYILPWMDYWMGLPGTSLEAQVVRAPQERCTLKWLLTFHVGKSNHYKQTQMTTNKSKTTTKRCNKTRKRGKITTKKIKMTTNRARWLQTDTKHYRQERGLQRERQKTTKRGRMTSMWW